MDDHHVVKQHHLQHAPCSSGGRRPRGTQGLARTLCELDWTCVFVIIVLGISTAAVNRRAPVRRPIYVWDAATAYPHQPNSVPFWVAIAAPAAVLLAYSSAVELWALRSHQTWRRGALQLANVLLALLAALAATGFLTELFKRICGRLRCAPLSWRLMAGGSGAAAVLQRGTQGGCVRRARRQQCGRGARTRTRTRAC
jgi:hypothetical protein